MSLDDLVEFLKTLTENELETLYKDTIKEGTLIQYATNDSNILIQRFILSKIEEELQIRHLRDAGLQVKIYFNLFLKKQKIS